VLAFATQIYCDFSGYTDIGRGSATLLGYWVPENFARPYQATSPADFWHRWHMSLSSWLRDYLYIPLGGSRVPRWRLYVNLLVTMALGGLWHGAAWHYLVWGIYQGMLLSGHRLWATLVGGRPSYKRIISLPLMGILTRLVTFTLVCAGWVFFRANSIGSALSMLRSMFIPTHPWWTGMMVTPDSMPAILMAGASAVVVGGWVWAEIQSPAAHLWQTLTLRARWVTMVWTIAIRPSLYCLAIVVLVLVPPHSVQRFIYFQF
jgi:D-alanyl-lipoteichoic acid acyltransferase DltB (MBOAT superfamily)